MLFIRYAAAMCDRIAPTPSAAQDLCGGLLLTRLTDQAATVLAAVVMALDLVLLLRPASGAALPVYFFWNQDIWWLMAAILVMKFQFGAPYATGALRLAKVTDLAGARANAEASIFVLVALVIATTWGGTQLIHHYDGVRDELMASFDAAIFQSGRLMAPVAEEWRDYLPALLPRFGLPIVDNLAWASAYLPGNAAFRVVMPRPEWANPILAGVSIWAAWSLARLFWPDRRDAAWIAALLMATSTQFLMMAMTSFAMPGHLALNLVWLRLYLRSDWRGHLGACALGAIACGWHQLAFHPLFVAPFILHAWWCRRWMVAVGYSAFYAVVGLGWLSYAKLAASMAGVTLAGGFDSGVAHLWQVVGQLVGDASAQAPLTMVLNLSRFVAWQNPILVPLMLAAALAPRRIPLPLRLGFCGLLLTLAAALIVMPYQGHGWGYRYLHGYIGLCALIAAAAWVEIVPVDGASRARNTAAFAGACAFVVVLQLPGQATMVHQALAPYARASDQIASASAGIVVVDDRGLFYGEDLVRNDPFLQNRPITLLLGRLGDAQIDRLCEHRTAVAVFDTETRSARDILGAPAALFPNSADIERRKARLKKLPCVVALEPKP